MNRAEKVEMIERMNEELTSSPHLVLTTFSGLSVNQATEFRSKVRQAGGRCRVIRNRLAKRAAAGTPMSLLSEQLSGPCALVTHPDDPVALAKSVAEFVKDNPELQLLAGVIDSKDLLDKAGVKELAALPSLDELRAQLLALIQTPATTLVRLIGTPATQIARVVGERGKQLEEAS